MNIPTSTAPANQAPPTLENLKEFIIRAGSLKGRRWEFVKSTTDGHVFQHGTTGRLFPHDSVQRLMNGEVVTLCFHGMRGNVDFFGDWSKRDRRIASAAASAAAVEALAEGERQAKAHPKYALLVEQLAPALEKHLADARWTAADCQRKAEQLITAVFNSALTTAYVVAQYLNTKRCPRTCQAFAEVTGISIPRRASDKAIVELLEPLRSNIDA